MGKVERLHSERLALPWTQREDDLAARLRMLTKQLQHPAHPVNALNHLGPVRLGSFPCTGELSSPDSQLHRSTCSNICFREPPVL